MVTISEIYILGIGITHNSTVCLLKDGELLCAASEERFVRIKNINCYPINAIKYCLDHAGITMDKVTLVAHGFSSSSFGGGENSSTARGLYAKASFFYHLYPSFGKFLSNIYQNFYSGSWKNKIVTTLAENLKIEKSRILPVDHHTCHAFAAYYGVARSSINQEKDSLVFTLDAEGDGLCATINIANGPEFKRINESKRGNSLAAIYAATTEVLGMKSNEHEYKVMGLAPYASSFEVAKSYPIFDNLILINEDLQFKSKLTYASTQRYLSQQLIGHRFDGIAGAVQKLSEERAADWVTKTIGKYSIGRVSIGGGFFMNVKVNMALGKIDQVKDLHICPTSGDESVAIGAAYYGYKQCCISAGKEFVTKPLRNLYLGPEYTDTEVESILENYCNKQYFSKAQYPDIDAAVAELLSKNHIVARYRGRMEWGARALGNRSILANPSCVDSVKVINEQIKCRDFWMPFAPTIIEERESDYLINTKDFEAPFMSLAFETTERAHQELLAAIHPYDLTARPQVLTKEANLEYYNLIKEFESITGIGALLNTSFNLHGEPIVCTPTDALDTFSRSGLKYLAIGHYLISKKAHV